MTCSVVVCFPGIKSVFKLEWQKIKKGLQLCNRLFFVLSEQILYWVFPAQSVLFASPRNDKQDT